MELKDCIAIAAILVATLAFYNSRIALAGPYRGVLYKEQISTLLHILKLLKGVANHLSCEGDRNECEDKLHEITDVVHCNESILPSDLVSQIYNAIDIMWTARNDRNDSTIDKAMEAFDDLNRIVGTYFFTESHSKSMGEIVSIHETDKARVAAVRNRLLGITSPPDV